MHDAPTEWTALLALVFLLGLRHGLDADHLAAIDGLTRYNAQRRRPFAGGCGLLFSLGHGFIVIAIALAVALARRSFPVPVWLELTGAWISIGLLALIGTVNLRAVLLAGPHEIVTPVPVKGRLLRRAMHAGHPLTVALVGALYALSFDTVSQSVLFAVAGTQFGGPGSSLLLGFLFTLGMAIADGLNGLWISRLITRSDRLGVLASRVMGVGIAATSLLAAAYGISKLALADLGRWSGGHEWIVGGGVIALILLSYALARRRTLQPVRA